MSNTNHSLQSRITARNMLAQMGGLQFAIASDLLRVLSRVPNNLNIEEAHTVSMEVCEYLESRLLYAGDDGTQGRSNTPTLVETVVNELSTIGA